MSVVAVATRLNMQGGYSKSAEVVLFFKFKYKLFNKLFY